MKFFRSKLFLGIVCLVMAIAVGFVGVPLLNNITNEKVPAVRFKESTAKGSVVTAQDLEVIQISPNGLPADVLTDPAEAVDKYLVADAQVGDYATSARLSAQRPYDNKYLYDLPRGKLAVSFSTTFSGGLSGKVAQGDIVSLLTMVGNIQNPDGTVEVAAESSPALSYLKVLSATSADGEDTDGEKKDADGKLILPVTVTVMANTEQTKLIAGLEQQGTIQLALVTRGNEAYASELLAAQDDYFAQQKELSQPPAVPETPRLSPPAASPEEETDNVK